MKLKNISIGTECHIKPDALKSLKKTLGYVPQAPFEVLDHDIDNTTVLVSTNSDDDGRSFSLSSDMIAVPKATKEKRRIKGMLKK